MKKLFAFVIPVILFAACKGKDEDKNPIPSNLDFSTYQTYDVFGAPTGIHGTGTDDDYQQEDRESWVYQLFTPMDTADLSGTTAGNIQLGRFYPNPAGTTQEYYYTVSNPVIKAGPDQ